MISFASDGASNVAGRGPSGKSVISRILAENPNIKQIKCICHSLALCVKHAFEENMPKGIHFLIAKIPAFFSHSSVRQSNFKDLHQFETLLDSASDCESKNNCLPFRKDTQVHSLLIFCR